MNAVLVLGCVDELSKNILTDRGTVKRIKIAWSTEREVLAALLILLLLIVVMSIVAFSLVVGFSRTLQTLDRSRDIAIAAESMNRYLLDAETSQRGYIITGDESYLESYEQNVTNIHAAQELLNRLFAQASQYSHAMRILMVQIDSRLVEMENTVVVRRTLGFDAAKSVIGTDLGESLMGHIEDALRQLILIERGQFMVARELVILRIRTIAGLAIASILCVIVLTTVVYLLVRRDIRARQRVEQGLSTALRRERELNELKSHFIRTVSHEFRTPLAIIQTSTDLLQRYSDRMTETRREEHYDKLQAQVVRLTALLEDAVTIQRSQLADLTYEPATHDLRAVCRQAIASVEDLAAGRRLDFMADGSSFTSWVDAELIERALHNLLANALQYSGAAGVVRVQLTCTPTVTTIDVIDQGTGIAYDDQPRLFELFYRGANTADVPGTGLGLSVAKSIVDLHSGVIRYQSTPGAGSTFTIELPVLPVLKVGIA